MLLPLLTRSLLNLNTIAACEIVLSVFEALKAQAVNALNYAHIHDYYIHRRYECLVDYSRTPASMHLDLPSFCQQLASEETKDKYGVTIE